MKVLTPFWDMNYYNRFIPQFESIGKHCDLNVVYDRGNPPDSKYINFIKMKYVNRWIRAIEYLKIVKDVKPDILYCLSGLFFEICSYYSGDKLGIPIVMRLRGNDIKQKKDTRGKLNAYIHQEFYRNIWYKYKFIIPISFRLYDVWINRHKLDNVVKPVYNGVDSDTFYPIDNNMGNELTLGYVGRISEEKGGHILEDLFNKTPDIKYIVAGRNDLNIELPDNVKFIGWVDLDTLNKEVYNKVDYTILPSYYEGVPNVILESYLTDTPMIASNKSIPYDIECYGYLLPLNKEIWIKFINNLNSEKEFRLNVTMRDYVKKNFNWNNYGNIIYSYFEEALR